MSQYTPAIAPALEHRTDNQTQKKRRNKTMKKRYVNITLNEQSFILDSKETTTETVVNVRDIDDCYGRCSSTKRAIWEFWQRWFIQNNGLCTISSHNCNFFTVTGYVTDKETGERYFCYITRSYNRCLKVSN